MPNNLTDFEENRLLDLSLLNTDELALIVDTSTDSTAGTEVVGGTYARQVLTFAAAAGGSKATSSALLYSGMPATPVTGWEVWDTGGTDRKWYGLFSPFKTASAAAATDIITATGHGRTDTDEIVFQSGYCPAGLTAGTIYFVRDSTTNTFKVAATSGGVAIDITADMGQVVFGNVIEVTLGEGFAIASGALICTLDS